MIRRLETRLTLSLALLAGPVVTALAGQDTMGGTQQPQRLRIDNRIEKAYTVTLEAESAKDYCHARAEFEYWQDNTLAHIEGVINNADCGASGGTYAVRVVYVDAEGTRQTHDHSESWSRRDAEPFRFDHDYEIGENVDLIRVSARKVDCICTGPPGEGDAGEENEAITGEIDE